MRAYASISDQDVQLLCLRIMISLPFEQLYQMGNSSETEGIPKCVPFTDNAAEITLVHKTKMYNVLKDESERVVV